MPNGCVKLPVTLISSAARSGKSYWVRLQFPESGAILLAAIESVSWDGGIGGGRLVSSGVGRGTGGNRTGVVLVVRTRELCATTVFCT